jgi:predicted ATPase
MLFFDGARLIPPGWTYRNNEAALSHVLKTYKETEMFRAHLADCLHYAGIDLGQAAPARQPQDVDPTACVPSASGDDLISVLFNLRGERHEAFERVLDALRAAYPDLGHLDFQAAARGKIVLRWIERNAPDAFEAFDLSEGTLRYLWLVTILLSPTPPAMLLIDEPEVSLHPVLLHLLAGLLKEAGERTQVVVATHSDRLIRWLEPGDLLICDKDDDGVHVRRGDDPALGLDAWMKDYTLDELWLAGQLGGRP